MRLIGWALAIVGIAFLAFMGVGLWGQAPPTLAGLTFGQLIVIPTVAIAVGLVLIARRTPDTPDPIG